jgi:hypothetical protein
VSRDSEERKIRYEEGLKSYCTYCLRTREEVRKLEPVYDWNNGKLSGYYCEDHIEQVKNFQYKQERAYREEVARKGQKKNPH